MKFHGHESTFLSNKMNKQWIIDLIGMHLTQQGCQVVHSNDYADLDIMMTCLNSAEMETTTLIGEGTDLIILLLYWMQTSTFNIYVRSTTLYDTAAIRKNFDDISAKVLLFIHAFTGRDTTVQIFSTGKQKALRNINKSEELKEKALLFCTSGSASDSLNDCSRWLFLEQVMVSKNFVEPEKPPPTQSAAKYHCFIPDCCFDMDPTKWGWCLQDNKYIPKLMDLPAAPLKLL
ncbi:hypothetical protein PR048_001781 [Dryococelus australis]|uniref:Uncharacterized protein n=1 Tax=Dryococelus australis TaxID=614101 RepID=A0ABQ9IJ15_9NEOP|nr:hypothetical protein PR048_001781 [Dryococelus australis]